MTSSSPAHRGPVYGPLAMLEVDEFCAQLLADLAANGILVGQLHAEYGLAQMELAISPPTRSRRPTCSCSHARRSTRQRAPHGLRASFAPLVTLEAAATAGTRTARSCATASNLLAGGDGPHGLTAEGEAWLAGLVRELPALAAVAAPERALAAAAPARLLRERVRVLGRPEPRGVAALHARDRARSRDAANIELKASDASGNPYLTLAAIISAGLAGIAEGLTLSEPINVDPGSWTEAERERRGVALLPTTTEQQIAAVEASLPVRDALGEPIVGAWSAVRRADATWAKGKTADEIVTRHRWSY